MQVEEQTVINRPVETVFAFVSDVSRWPEWTTAVIEARLVDGDTMRQGATIRTVTHFLGRRIESDQVVREYEPNRRIVGDTMSGPLHFRITNTFEPAGESATRVTWSIEGEPEGFFRVAAPVLRGMVKRQVESQLGNLKDLLEAGAD